MKGCSPKNCESPAMVDAVATRKVSRPGLRGLVISPRLLSHSVELAHLVYELTGDKKAQSWAANPSATA